MDAPLLTQHELVRPWRRATLVASLVAAIELVLLIAASTALLAKPLAHSVQQHAESSAFTPTKTATLKVPKTVAVGLPRLARQETGVVVLNGNGHNGAAATAADRLRGIGYAVQKTADAPRHDYAATVVMYRAGYKPEALRLARDLHLKTVAPLDGISPGSLLGGHLVLLLGAG